MDQWRAYTLIMEIFLCMSTLKNNLALSCKGEYSHTQQPSNVTPTRGACICTRMCVVALFVIAITRNNRNVSLAGNQINCSIFTDIIRQ